MNEETRRALPKGGLEELTANGNGNCQHSSGQPSTVGTEDDGNLAPSGGALKVMGLSGMSARKMKLQHLEKWLAKKGLL